ncbi:bZIP transcription factor 44-like [Andrographis paniculata]|uniref:bZIP transcription factor 44-like n=1 Tax=Andrographis paniculata TaxID=175694 RepID=UPI0021E7C105|nr:bZIP transcription factor 44-like [Andrographis paniculata]
MDSSSSHSSGLQNSGSEEDLQLIMEQRKRKRMISNRESARRSRLRKQKHLDGLMAQVAHIRKENQQILTTVNLTKQQYVAIQSENDILRAQLAELTQRLNSLNEIVSCLSAGFEDCEPAAYGMTMMMPSAWNCFSQLPSIVAAASADAAGFLY